MSHYNHAWLAYRMARNVDTRTRLGRFIASFFLISYTICVLAVVGALTLLAGRIGLSALGWY
jgi:hypothetical protein